MRFFLITLLTLTVTAGLAFADDPKARGIMERVEDRDDGDNSTSDMQMTLIDKHGKKRIREIKSFGKDKGEDKQRLMFFLSPADVKDTGFLTYDYDDGDRDDDQWLYLPALRKTKRIASSDKSGSFMGSDFTYSDMTQRDLDDYDYKLLKESKVGEHKVVLIESTPRSRKVIDETGYTKSVVFVRTDIDFVVRAVHWVKDGGKLKYFDVKKLEKIDGIWTARETHMTTKKGKATVHKTILTFDNVKYNQGLSENLFSIRILEKGL